MHRFIWPVLRVPLFLLAFAVLQNASAGALEGRVVGVTDGDTITVLDSSNRQHKIRFAGIDAPEKNQPYGQRAKEHLSELVFNRQVNVETEKKDRKRTVNPC